jgi:hypothetical protein
MEKMKKNSKHFEMGLKTKVMVWYIVAEHVKLHLRWTCKCALAQLTKFIEKLVNVHHTTPLQHTLVNTNCIQLADCTKEQALYITQFTIHAWFKITQQIKKLFIVWAIDSCSTTWQWCKVGMSFVIIFYLLNGTSFHRILKIDGSTSGLKFVFVYHLSNHHVLCSRKVTTVRFFLLS